MIRIVTVNKETGEIGRCQYDHNLRTELAMKRNEWPIMEKSSNYAVLCDETRVRIISEIQELI